MRKILVSILLLLSSITLPAQSPQVGWETLYAQLLEQDDEAGQSDEETYELLSELAEHPIVLNQATREDLERIPFLSETQIEELIAYITQYHGMRTMGELSLIESLDGLRRALLPYFLLLTDDETTHYPSLHTLRVVYMQIKFSAVASYNHLLINYTRKDKHCQGLAWGPTQSFAANYVNV